MKTGLNSGNGRQARGPGKSEPAGTAGYQPVTALIFVQF